MKKTKRRNDEVGLLACSSARNSGFASNAAQFTDDFSLIRNVRLGSRAQFGKRSSRRSTHANEELHLSITANDSVGALQHAVPRWFTLQRHSNALVTGLPSNSTGTGTSSNHSAVAAVSKVTTLSVMVKFFFTPFPQAIQGISMSSGISNPCVLS